MTGKLRESGNGRWFGRSVRVTVEREMRAFDRLPPEMRKAFREAITDSTATGWTRHLKLLGPAGCAAALAKIDREDAFLFLAREFDWHSAGLISGRNSP